MEIFEAVIGSQTKAPSLLFEPRHGSMVVPRRDLSFVHLSIDAWTNFSSSSGLALVF